MTKQKKSKPSLANTLPEMRCDFCKKEFKREAAFIAHMCRYKKRFIDRDLQPNRIAHMAYVMFYKSSHMQYRKEPSIENFINSHSYEDFLKLGNFIVGINAIATKEYIAYLLKSNLPIRDWIKDDVYLKFVLNLNRTEDWQRAVERSIIEMEKWAIKNDKTFRQFFIDISPSDAIHLIATGRISPWVFFLSRTGAELNSKLSPEQSDLLSRAINIQFWRKRILTEKKTVSAVSAFLQDVGL